MASMLAWMEVGGTLLASSSITNLSHCTVHSMRPPFFPLFFTHRFAKVRGVMDWIVSSHVWMRVLYSSSLSSMTFIYR